LYKLLKQMQGEENKNGFSKHLRRAQAFCRRLAARIAISENLSPHFAG
jgi:hypothetical protein